MATRRRARRATGRTPVRDDLEFAATHGANQESNYQAVLAQAADSTPGTPTIAGGRYTGDRAASPDLAPRAAASAQSVAAEGHDNDPRDAEQLMALPPGSLELEEEAGTQAAALVEPLERQLSAPPTPTQAGAGDMSRLQSLITQLKQATQPIAAPSCSEMSTDDLCAEMLRRMGTAKAPNQADNARSMQRSLEAFHTALTGVATKVHNEEQPNRALPVNVTSSDDMLMLGRPTREASTGHALAEKRPRLVFHDEIDPDHPDPIHDNTRLPVPSFDGKNWSAFKSVFESVANHYRWSPKIKALRLKCCIKGEAQAALGVIDAADWNYEQLVEHLELRHGRNRTKVEVMTELDQLYRKPGQSITAWRDEVITVANTGSLTVKQYRELTHYNFLKGLGTYPQMMSWVSEHDKVETLQSCYDWAQRYEREVGTPTLVAHNPARIAAHHTQAAAAPNVEQCAAISTGFVPRAPQEANGGNQSVAAAGNSQEMYDKMIKANREASDLVSKLQTELAEAKRQNNNRRGQNNNNNGQNNNNNGQNNNNKGQNNQGRGGQGRGAFGFGQGSRGGAKEASVNQHSTDGGSDAPNYE